MANEIKHIAASGATLKYGVYNPDGTEVTAPTTDLPEIGTTGYYTATNGDIAAGDIVVINNGAAVVGGYEYQPTGSDLASIEGKVDTAIAAASRITNVYNEVPQPKPTVTVY